VPQGAAHKGKFIVEVGSLGQSVTIFTICAVTCIMTLCLRRECYL
jgi:hypothetical protein